MELEQETFWEACGAGNLKIVRAYIKNGGDVNWANPDDLTETTGLMRAAAFGQVQIARELMMCGSINVLAVDTNQFTALHWVALCLHGTFEDISVIPRLLLDAGVPANCETSWVTGKFTPMDFAIRLQNHKIIRVLEMAGDGGDDDSCVVPTESLSSLKLQDQEISTREDLKLAKDAEMAMSDKCHLQRQLESQCDKCTAERKQWKAEKDRLEAEVSFLKKCLEDMGKAKSAVAVTTSPAE